MKKAFVAALAFVAFSAVQASAVTIDFTNPAWAPAFLADTVVNGNTTVESIPDNSAAGALSWSAGNGFGVLTPLGLDPQIGAFEGLRITFSQPFTLSSFLLGNLSGINIFGNFIPEIGFYSVNGGAWQQVIGAPGGNVNVNLGPIGAVTSLVFGYDGFALSNFTVKSVTGEFQTTQPPAVPEPTSMVLLGTGLAGLVARARRKKA